MWPLRNIKTDSAIKSNNLERMIIINHSYRSSGPWTLFTTWNIKTSSTSWSLSQRHFIARRQPAFARYSVILSVAWHYSSMVAAFAIWKIYVYIWILIYYTANCDILSEQYHSLCAFWLYISTSVIRLSVTLHLYNRLMAQLSKKQEISFVRNYFLPPQIQINEWGIYTNLEKKSWQFEPKPPLLTLKRHFRTTNEGMRSCFIEV